MLENVADKWMDKGAEKAKNRLYTHPPPFLYFLYGFYIDQLENSAFSFIIQV